MRLRIFMAKTFDRIADPAENEPILRDLFEIRHLLYQLTENKSRLRFIQNGLR